MAKKVVRFPGRRGQATFVEAFGNYAFCCGIYKD